MSHDLPDEPHELIDVWQNVLARDELEQHVERARPILIRLAEAFARADARRQDATDLHGVVEDIHVKLAGDVLYALARTPEVYAKTGLPELFVSYASEQKKEVGVWVSRLEAASFRCFLADKSILYSTDWAEEIWHALRVCRSFLPIVTTEWVRSRWCMYELGAAVALNKPVVPVIIGAVDVSPPLSEQQGFQLESIEDMDDLQNGQPELWHRILKELRRLCYCDENS
jgi:hypothetical protein